MRQLVLPFNELMADDMELALLAPYRFIDWGTSWSSEYMGYPLRAAGKSYYEEVLGQWRDIPEDKQRKFIDDYDLERFRAMSSTKPWTQLMLPLTAGYRVRPSRIRGRAAYWVALDDAANFI